MTLVDLRDLHVALFEVHVSTERTCDSSIDDWPTSVRHALHSESCDGDTLALVELRVALFKALFVAETKEVERGTRQRVCSRRWWRCHR